MANKKRIATTLGAMALTAVIAIGGTLAYLSNITETKRNTFTSSGNIKGEIEESDWETNHPNGWNDYKPGEATAKSPVVSLEKGSESAYVAMKLSFKNFTEADENNENGVLMSYDTFKAYASHDGIKAGWKLIAKNKLGEELYAYNDKVEASETTAASTAPIFTKVTVNAGIETIGNSTTTEFFHRVIEKDGKGNIIKDVIEKTNETSLTSESYFIKDGKGNYVAVGKDTLPKFEIAAQGYAIQSATFANADAANAELIKLANVGVDATSDAYFTATV